MLLSNTVNVDFMYYLREYFPIVAGIIAIVVVILVVIRIYKSVQSAARRIRSTIRDVSNITSTIKEVATAVEEMPDVKDVGGATEMFIKNIVKDFPDFHNSSAESDISTFIQEYINIIYGTATDFKKSKVSSKIDISTNKVKSGLVNNIRINKIAIYDYKKTKEYATIRYRVSVGFDVDGKRVETRYEVEYTYQVYKDSIATAQMKCTVCGAPIEDLNKGVCPYCGAAFIKDTIMSWDITSIKNF